MAATETELDRRGWHLTGQSITELCSDGNKNINEIIKKALDADLKDIGAVWLNEDINTGKADFVTGPCVLQLLKLRSISSPQDDDQPLETPHMCLLSLTDGHTTCSAVTLEPIENLSLSTPPGSKLLLSGTVEVEANFLLLSNRNTVFLGGWVDALAEPWKLKKALAKESKTLTNAVGEGAPPLFVPFGQKIASDLLLPLQKDDFKSLHKTKERKVTEDEIQFRKLRQAALAEANEAKIANERLRAYGGENHMDARDAARMMHMGTQSGPVQRNFNGGVQHGYQNGGYRGNAESSNLYKPSGVESSLSSDLSYKFNRQATIGRHEGPGLPFQGQHQPMPYSQHRQGYQRMNVAHSNSAQHRTNTPQNGRVDSAGEDRSCINKSSAIPSQNLNSAKENSHESRGVKVAHEGSNQNSNSEKLQELPSKNEQKSSESINIAKIQEERTHGSPGQYVQKSDIKDANNKTVQDNQKVDSHNAPGRYVQREETKYNSGNPIKSNNPDESPVRNNPGGQINGSNRYYNKEDSNRQGSGLFNSQQPPGAYQHKPPQSNAPAAKPERQGYNNHQQKHFLNVGEECLARYWEDKQFYPAIVKALTTEGRALVMFHGFRNVEEVGIQDTMPCPYQTYPVPQPAYGLQSTNPPPGRPVPFPGPPPFMQAAAGFNNSGSYFDNRGHYSPGRPTQQYYRPPQGRYH